MILKVKGLTKRFEDLVAVSDVNLEIEKGEIFGIAGPNGAGKSTLFNLISGMFPPSSGTIEFQGNSLGGLKPHRICAFGLARTFQVPTTFHTLTVLGNIRIGALFGDAKKSVKDTKKKIDEVIELLELTDKRDVLAEKLDLYTTKLVMFGAALATSCRLILLDEPMAGLSVTEIDHFRKLLRNINKEQNITIMIIEHLIDTLVDISDRIMVLHLGQVIYTGLSEQMTKDERVIEVYLGEREE